MRSFRTIFYEASLAVSNAPGVNAFQRRSEVSLRSIEIWVRIGIRHSSYRKAIDFGLLEGGTGVPPV